MNRMIVGWVASLALVVAQGCAPPVSDTRGDYLAGLAILASTPRVTPTPAPAPEDDCQSCGGQGWLGDGRIKFDCPDCDLDPPLSSLPVDPSSTAPTSPDQSTPKESALTHEAAGPVSGVVVEPRKRLTYLSLPACGPCRRWEQRVLNDPLVQAELAAWWDYQGKVNASAVSPKPDRVPKVRIIDPVAGSIIDLVPAGDAVSFVQQLRGLR